MAMAAVKWAYEQHHLASTEKFVLVTLAERASVGEWFCFPSIRDICERTGLVRSTVMKNINKLKLLGLIKVENRMRDRGGYRSSGYTLNPSGDVRQADHPPSSKQTPPVRQTDHPSPSDGHPYIRRNQSQEPVTAKQKKVTEKMCLEVYGLYPRKRGKAAALKAIRKAIGAFGFDPLKAAVSAFADEWQRRQAKGDSITYCPYPQKWFNEGRYEDEVESTASSDSVVEAEMTVWQLTELRKNLEEQALEIKGRYCSEESHFTHWDSETRRKEHRELLTQIASVKVQLNEKADTVHKRRKGFGKEFSGSASDLVAGIINKVKGANP